MAQVKYIGSFYYRSGMKHYCVQYFERKVTDTRQSIVSRDIDENEKCRFNCQRCISQRKKKYTPEKLEEPKEFSVYMSSKPIV